MTATVSTQHHATILRPLLVGGLALGLLFSLVTWVRFPASPAQTILYAVAPVLVVLCGVVSFVSLRPTRSLRVLATWRLSAIFGLTIGLLWIIEIMVGNIVAVESNVSRAIYTGATVAAFALPLIAGAVGAYRLGTVRSGIAVGFWSGLLSGLIAYLTLMFITYVFMGTLQHDPQTLREYAHSSERALSTFIVGDFLFASCSHLVLIGVLWGTATAAVGAIVGKANRATTTRDA